jgi:hypothetical protein
MLDEVKQQLDLVREQLQAVGARLARAKGGRVPHLLVCRLGLDLDKMRGKLDRHAAALDAAAGK